MKFLITLFALLSFVGVAMADGYLDKEPGPKGQKVQIISPKKSVSDLFSPLSGKVSERPVVNTTNLKVLGFQAAAADNTAIPVEVRLCSGTTAATCNTDPMIYSTGAGIIGIGSDVKGVSFGVISSSTVTRKISVQGR